MQLTERPKIISVTSIVCIVLILLSFPLLFTPSIKRLGDFVPLILGVIITLQFVSIIGVWYMKKWGVQFFVVTFFARVMTFMLLNLFGFRFYFNITYSCIAIIIFLVHYKKMNDNL